MSMSPRKVYGFSKLQKCEKVKEKKYKKSKVRCYDSEKEMGGGTDFDLKHGADKKKN